MQHELAPEIVSELQNRLTQLLHPDDILLFGSYARGNATADSDVDIMVILPNGAEAGRQRRIETRRYIQDIFYERNLAFDLIMRTRENFDKYKHLRVRCSTKSRNMEFLYVPSDEDIKFAKQWIGFARQD